MVKNTNSPGEGCFLLPLTFRYVCVALVFPDQLPYLVHNLGDKGRYYYYYLMQLGKQAQRGKGSCIWPQSKMVEIELEAKNPDSKFQVPTPLV